jgi:mRNA interferase MazF
MLTSGDIVEVDLGVPQGSEAGMTRPAVTVTAQRILSHSPNVVQIVPLTRTIRGHATEVTVPADDHNGLAQDSAAQCQHVRAVATSRIIGAKGNVGSLTLAQIRDTLALLMDL